jgi:hypothetical protein
MDANAPLAPGVFDLRAAGATTAPVVTIQQLAGGRVFRTFTSYPRSEAELVAKLDRIAAGYNMTATRVTIS